MILSYLVATTAFVKGTAVGVALGCAACRARKIRKRGDT